jgi:DNA modification methylase
MMCDGNASLSVTYMPINSLTAYTRNPRVHSKRQIQQIAASIEAFGLTNPILIDRKNVIVAGHGRVAAARSLGIKEVPTIRLEGLTEVQIRAYVIADNRLAEKASWDKEVLAIELQNLITIQDEIDVALTGFEIPEIDLLIQELPHAGDPTDELRPDETGPPTSRVGDLWILGRHRILCGDALNQACFETLMAGQRADIAFVDPPFNIAIAGNVSGKGKKRHKNFVMAAGEMTESEFITFLSTSLGLVARNSRPGSVHFICMDWRHLHEMITTGKQVYQYLLNVCVWVKDNGGMGSLYRSRHEMVFVFQNGHKRHRNNVQLGKFGRNRTNVWEYPGLNTLSRTSDEGNLLTLHPTVKPVKLIADALLDCSAPGDIVLDSFLGSGSTLLAAERTGRLCCGLELEPAYVDVAVRRWQRHTGGEAIHAGTGAKFNAVSIERVA